MIQNQIVVDRFDKKLPHILHVIDGLLPGGAERVLIEIANATDKSQYRVSVCVTRSDVTLAHLLNSQVSLFRLGRRSTFDLEKMREFADYCKHEQVDLIQAHMRSSFLFVVAIQIMHFLPALPVIFMEHDGDVEINNHIPLAVGVGLNVIRPFFVGVHDELTKGAIRAGLAHNKALTISNAINFSAYQVQSTTSLAEILGRSVQTPVGIMVANIRPTKNHFFLLDALAKLKHKKWTLLLVGGAPDQKYLSACQHRVKELDLEDNVVFLGSRTDIPILLHLVDFGVLTSKSESGPLVLLEYIAARLPFVSTRVGTIGKTLDSLGIPAFFAPQDINGFACALQELMDITQSQREARVGQALRLSEPIFDIESVMVRWHKFYGGICRLQA